MAEDKDVEVNVDVDTEVDIDTKINIAVTKARDLLEKILGWMKDKKKRATHIVVKVGGHEMEEGEMGKPLANTDVRHLELIPKTDKEKRAKVQDGTMVATSDNEAACTVALDPQDQLLAILTPVDGASAPKVTFTFKADADLTEGGVQEITGVYDCEITSENATMIDPIEAGDFPKAPTVTPVRKP